MCDLLTLLLAPLIYFGAIAAPTCEAPDPVPAETYAEEAPEPEVGTSPTEPEPEPTPEPEAPEPEPEPEPTPEPEPEPERSHWDRLADCESGNWIDRGASFETGSARWDWAKPGTEVPPWGTTIHHGGLQFHPDTWTWKAPEGFPEFAYNATREQQIEVGRRVQEAQGWGAWPVCSVKVGLR